MNDNNYVLIIEHDGGKWAYPLPFWSTNKTEQGRNEENLYFGAVKMYDEIYMHPRGICNQPPGMPSSQLALPWLAKHYGLNRNEIVSAWAKEYGVYRALGPLPANPPLKESVK